MILDRIEYGLKDTPFKKIIDGIFSGTSVSRVVCQNCGATSTSDQPFLNLSMEVKNITSLERSLEKFI
jgi:ubiquitin C-terminal hydrolase